MRHPIDPKVDCVFKALLGAESNRDLLIHFLNAVLGAELPRPIVAVDIQNPYNEKEFLDDKLTVVDVKARDAIGQMFQVEIQLLNHRDLPARILYGWANLYRSQIKEGESYRKLRPTYAIWLLGQTLLPDDPEYAHAFRLRDQRGRSFLDHGGIWLLELSKFAADAVETEEQRWLKFFNEAERLDEDALPAWMQTHEMRRAMNTLKAFSEKEHAYHAYQARQDYLREQQSIQLEFEDLRAEVEQERAAKEQARATAEQERAAKEQAQATAEQERAAKEQARATAEQERAAKEQARATAEQERAAKEQARATAEQALAAQERERAAKEEALAENERLKRLLADQSAPSGPGMR